MNLQCRPFARGLANACGILESPGRRVFWARHLRLNGCVFWTPQAAASAPHAPTHPSRKSLLRFSPSTLSTQVGLTASGQDLPW